MSARTREILHSVIATLRLADGTPLDVAVISLKVSMIVTPGPTLRELTDVISRAEAEGLAAGTTTISGSQLWAITNKGRLAEL